MNLGEARKQYKEVTGKNASPRASLETLLEKINEVQEIKTDKEIIDNKETKKPKMTTMGNIVTVAPHRPDNKAIRMTIKRRAYLIKNGLYEDYIKNNEG